MSNETNIEKQVLEKIQAGAVSMRPRSYFVLRVVAIGVVSLLALGCSLLTFSFVLFSIHESGEEFLLGFGIQGVATFFALFPWAMFTFSIVLLIVLETLLRNFKFAYQLPLLRVFLLALLVVGVGSLAVGLTQFHPYLLERADHDQLPIVGSWYEEIHDSHQPQGVYRGTITAITDSHFIIAHNDRDKDSDEGTWGIVPPKGFATTTLSIGERVYIAGRLINGMVYAYGIQVLPKSE